MFRLTFERLGEDLSLLREGMGRYDEMKENPFLGGRGRRPLRLTFHSETLAALPEEDRLALDMLRTFCHEGTPEIEGFDTADNAPLPLLTVGLSNALPRGEDLEAKVDYRNGRKRWSMVRDIPWWPRTTREVAAEITGESEGTPESEQLALHLPIAATHKAVGDILVTASSSLLNHRDHEYIGRMNPLTPSEAARVVGVLLRSRGQYIYRTFGNWPKSGVSQCDRMTFYLTLTSARLPAMRRYFRACMQARAVRKDDTEQVGQSITERTARAHVARDAIGRQFYLEQNNDTREEMMYHLDYLLLLLGGAFDSQARIAHRAYELTTDEKRASFRGKDFLKALDANGGSQLATLVRATSNRALLDLIFRLRNRIHGATLAPIALLGTADDYGNGNEDQESRVTLPEEETDIVNRAVAAHGGANAWGVETWGLGVWLEPYQFASTLLATSLELLNAVAEATAVEGLLPSPSTLSNWTSLEPQVEEGHDPRHRSTQPYLALLA